MPRIKRLALAVSALLALPFAANAQVPERFPSIPEAELERAIANAYCARTISTISHSIASYQNWRAYGILLCDEDSEEVGSVVAWFQRDGNRDAIVTLPDGRLLPRPDVARQNWGDQQAQLTVFAAPMRGGAGVCVLARANRRQAPFTATFCELRQRN